MDELPVLLGFREMALRRMAEQRAGLVHELVEQRLAAGLSQTEVAARMGTSQSAVARLESGGGGQEIPWPIGPRPRRPSSPGRPAPDPGPVPPTRVWLDPDPGLPDPLAERLLKQRVVLVSGVLDDAAATRLSAQLLTLDAEGDGPVRLELQNLKAELPAALMLMGILDVVRAEVQALASGEAGGPALGV